MARHTWYCTGAAGAKERPHADRYAQVNLRHNVRDKVIADVAELNVSRGRPHAM